MNFLDDLKAAVERAGLKPDNFWLHKFRATFCTWHLWNGTDLITAQSWMGHTDLASTMRYLRVAGNQCIDVLRRRQRGRRTIAEVGDGAAVIEAASSEPSPLGAVISTEERAKVREAIAGLPENYRLPLVPRYYSELSYDEIAQQLDLERNYVAVLIFRAKQSKLILELADQQKEPAEIALPLPKKPSELTRLKTTLKTG
jgi:hypothetical protein